MQQAHPFFDRPYPRFYKIEIVIEHSFHDNHADAPPYASALTETRQDAREGGVNPPLPRNCERACRIRRLHSRRYLQDPQPGSLHQAIHKPLKAACLWEGG